MITQKIIARTDSLKLDKIISRYGEDSMRQVVFIVVRPEPDSEELIPITIPEDAVGSFRILKPSGNFVIVPMNKSVLSTGETAFDVVLPASANTSKGSGYYDIRITSETDKYYYTAQGDFIIDDNIISDEVLEDVSEVNGLIFPDDFLTVEDNVAYIDDDIISTDRTWSSNKINEEIEAHAGGDVSKTVSGNPVTFTDGAAAPLVKCVTEIQGSQDLHGYDKPWVGGAGKNKAITKSSSFTANNVTFTINADGSITLNGTADATGNVKVTDPITVNAGTTYTVSIGVSASVIGYGVSGFGIGTYTITPTNDYSDACVQVRTVSGTAYNTTIYPQLEVGSSATSYEPYSNICPITAYTEGEIEVSSGADVYDSEGTDGYNVNSLIEIISKNSFRVYNTRNQTYASSRQNISIYNLVVGNTYTIEADVTVSSGVGMLSIRSLSNSILVSTDTITQNGHYKFSFVATLEMATLSFFCTWDTSTTGDVTYSNIRLYEGTERTTHTTTYPSAIYRGSEDVVNGEVTTEWAVIASYAGETLPGEWISDRDEYAPGTIPTTGAQVAYELATLTTSSVITTNLPIKSLSGYTHIESITGDMEVEYITQRFQPLIDSIKQL